MEKSWDMFVWACEMCEHKEGSSECVEMSREGKEAFARIKTPLRMCGPLLFTPPLTFQAQTKYY